MSSITFGSVGDIIAVCLLAKQIVDALDSSKGSASEYRSLVTELRSLEKTLLEVELVVRKDQNAANIPSSLSELPSLIWNCRTSLETLHEEIKKYNRHLSENSSSGMVGRFGMKVRWEVSVKAKITKFRIQIAAYCNAINMMLVTANVAMAVKSLDYLENSQTTTAIARNEQAAALYEIREVIQSNVQLSTSMTGMIRSLQTKFEWFSRLITSVRTLVHRGFMVNLATYKAVLSIQETLNYRIDRSLNQRPFILEDAMGRIVPVHLQFITSWNVFDAVLVARFEGLPGFDKIRRREFVLHEQATQREITRSRPWEGAFRPGQSVSMALTFERKTKSKNERNRCPHCWAETENLCTDEVTCCNCGMIYRRITDVVDVDSCSPPKMSNPWSRPHVFGEASFENSPSVFGPKPKRKWEPEDWQDLSEQISSFKRVRILTKEERIRNCVFSSWSKSSPLDALNASKTPVLSDLDWTSSKSNNDVRKNGGLDPRDSDMFGKGTALSSEEMIEGQKLVYKALQSFRQAVGSPRESGGVESKFPEAEIVDNSTSLADSSDQKQLSSEVDPVRYVAAQQHQKVSRWDCSQKREVETNRAILGLNHPDTLKSIAKLASIYQIQGRRGEAEKLRMQVMEICKTKLGLDHPDTLTSTESLVSTYWSHGQTEESEKLQVQVVEKRMTKQGLDDPDTLVSMERLASIYLWQSRMEEAEKLQLQVVETRKTKQGLDDLNTLMSMESLVSIYRRQGRMEEAKKLLVKVVEIRKTQLGLNNLYTVMSMEDRKSVV